jgi:hypothetical protein
MARRHLLVAVLTLACWHFQGVTASADDLDSVGCDAAGPQAEVTSTESCPHCEACRAGHSDQVAWYARFSAPPTYRGYFVGGGAALGGERRCQHEGTWGWDYAGSHLRRLVDLRWRHGGRPCANREGSYATD